MAKKPSARSAKAPSTVRVFLAGVPAVDDTDDLIRRAHAAGGIANKRLRKKIEIHARKLR